MKEGILSEQSDLEVVLDFFRQGGTVQALIGIDPVHLDSLYAFACQSFHSHDYVGAKQIFVLLVRLSHWQFDYWLGLGLVCQRLSEHDEAVKCFSQAGLLKLDDPRPSYLAGLSYQLAGNVVQARKANSWALQCCASRLEYAALRVEVLSQAVQLTQEVQT